MDTSTNPDAEEIIVSWPQRENQRYNWNLNPTMEANTEQDVIESAEPQELGIIRSAVVPAAKQTGKYVFLEHTADVQIHATGNNLKEVFGSCVVGMFAYMATLDEIGGNLEIEFDIKGNDLLDLLRVLMEECLYTFNTENFVVKQLVIKHMDLKKFTIKAVAKGGLFDATIHEQGTEVKAITFSNMIVRQKGNQAEAYVIVDI